MWPARARTGWGSPARTPPSPGRRIDRSPWPDGTRGEIRAGTTNGSQVHLEVGVREDARPRDVDRLWHPVPGAQHLEAERDDERERVVDVRAYQAGSVRASRVGAVGRGGTVR